MIYPQGESDFRYDYLDQNDGSAGSMVHYQLSDNCYQYLIPKDGYINVVDEFNWTNCPPPEFRSCVPRVHIRMFQKTYGGIINSLNRWFLLIQNDGIGGFLEKQGLLYPTEVWDRPYDNMVIANQICDIYLPYFNEKHSEANNGYRGEEGVSKGYWAQKWANFNPIISLGVMRGFFPNFLTGLNLGNLIGAKAVISGAIGAFAFSAGLGYVLPRIRQYMSVTNRSNIEISTYAQTNETNFTFNVELLNTHEEGYDNVLRNFEFVNFLLYNLTPRRRNMTIKDVPVLAEIYNGTEYIPFGAIDVTVTKKGRDRIINAPGSKLHGQTIPDAYSLDFNCRSLIENDGRFRLQALNGFQNKNVIGGGDFGTAGSGTIGSTQVFTDRTDLINRIEDLTQDELGLPGTRVIERGLNRVGS